MSSVFFSFISILLVLLGVATVIISFWWLVRKGAHRVTDREKKRREKRKKRKRKKEKNPSSNLQGWSVDCAFLQNCNPAFYDSWFTVKTCVFSWSISSGRHVEMCDWIVLSVEEFLPWTVRRNPKTVMPSCVFMVGWVLLYVHRNRRLIRDGNPGRPPRLSLYSFWEALRVFPRPSRWV